jgi:glycosyltransferase involved in cell wall biosynthesis
LKHRPRHLLYATSARLGGSGLDAVALESVRAAQQGGFLGRANAFDTRRSGLPPAQARSLRWHPVRLLSWLESEYYYGAKKHAVDAVSARELKRGAPAYDLFHGWSGDCVATLRAARQLGIRTVLEIPTWHRHKGRDKPTRLTKSERERAEARGWQGWKNRQLITRQQVLEEYDLADLILVLSQKAEETFLAACVPPEKLFRHHRGVDIARFSPAPQRPEIFRAVFVGALIQRKGVHHLLEVWKRLALPNAELVLAGTAHPEIEPWLREAGPSVKVLGFVPRVEVVYRSGAVHIFPSTCEGSAKCTYEAAACGLPQITTRESGDVVIDGINGLIIPPDDPEALAEVIVKLHRDRALGERMGAAGRERVVANFTWEHFRARLLQAYESVLDQAASSHPARQIG